MISPVSSEIKKEIRNFFLNIDKKIPERVLNGKTVYYQTEGTKALGITVYEDPFNGIHISLAKPLDHTVSAVFQKSLSELVKTLEIIDSYSSTWIEMEAPADLMYLGRIAPSRFKIGQLGKSDIFYDTQRDKICAWVWVSPEECTIPDVRTHTIGETCVLVDMVCKKVLLIENTMRPGSWNFPGGGYDLIHRGLLGATAKREFEEESGTLLPKEMGDPRIVAISEFPKNQFAHAYNISVAYKVNGLSLKKLNPPPKEIQDAAWISFDEIINNKDGIVRGRKLSNEIKNSLIAAIIDKGLSLHSSSDRKNVYTVK